MHILSLLPQIDRKYTAQGAVKAKETCLRYIMQYLVFFSISQLKIRYFCEYAVRYRQAINRNTAFLLIQAISKLQASCKQVEFISGVYSLIFKIPPYFACMAFYSLNVKLHY